MKLAFILPGKGHSGGIRCTVTTANKLLERGHEVRILYKKNPITVRTFVRRVRNELLYSGRYDWIEMFRGKTSSYNDIVQCKFYPDEIIIAVGITCSAQIGRIHSIKNSKLLYIHGLQPWTPEEMDQALSLPLPKVAVSSHIAEKIKSYDSSRLLAVIHNGIEQDEYFPSVSESLRDGVGTIFETYPSYAKDPQTILNVLVKLKKELPSIPHYIFGGAPKPKEISKTEYKRYPSVEEARRRYSSSKVWIVASRLEGFSVPVLEAMSCGCAVVATDCGGTRDIVVDGKNGYLVEVGNVDQIVSKVKLLLNNPTLRQEIVRNSRKTVNNLTWDNSVNKLENILKSIAIM